MSEAALKGSKFNYHEVDQVLSSNQFRMNSINMQTDICQSCKNNTFFDCLQYLNEEDDSIKKMENWIKDGGADLLTEFTNILQRFWNKSEKGGGAAAGCT